MPRGSNLGLGMQEHMINMVQLVHMVVHLSFGSYSTLVTAVTAGQPRAEPHCAAQSTKHFGALVHCRVSKTR